MGRENAFDSAVFLSKNRAPEHILGVQRAFQSFPLNRINEYRDVIISLELYPPVYMMRTRDSSAGCPGSIFVVALSSKFDAITVVPSKSQIRCDLTDGAMISTT